MSECCCGIQGKDGAQEGWDGYQHEMMQRNIQDHNINEKTPLGKTKRSLVRIFEVLF